MIKINVTDGMIWAMSDRSPCPLTRMEMRAMLEAAVRVVERDLNTGKPEGVLNCSEHDMGDCPYHRGPSREIWASGCVEVSD